MAVNIVMAKAVLFAVKKKGLEICHLDICLKRTSSIYSQVADDSDTLVHHETCFKQPAEDVLVLNKI